MSRRSDHAGGGPEGYRGYLLRQRRRAHAEADADLDAHTATTNAQCAAHPLIPAGPPELVVTQAALEALAEELREAARFAYDTEFIGEGSYRPKLCLIQLATAERVAIVDPIAASAKADAEGGEPLDLTPIWRLIADPGVETIVHAGQPDLEPVVRYLNQPPRSVFDTQIAAGFVADDYPVSLRNLVSRHLDLELPKALTFTAWDHRPISAGHLCYAADDVRYLLALRAALGGALDESGRTAWADEEFALLAEAGRYRFDVRQMVARIRRSYRPPRKHDVLLRKLVIWRERLAAERDLPTRAVLRDRLVAELARRAPGTIAELAETPQLPRWIVRDEGERVLGIVEAARGHRRWGKARRERPLTPKQQARVDRWWAAVKEVCAGRSLSLGLVVSRSVFEQLAKRAARGKSWPDDHPALSGWRAEILEPVLHDMGGDEAD